MQIYSAGEISGDYYMQIEPSLYHRPEMSKKENVNIYTTSVIRQSREELERQIEFCIVKKALLSLLLISFLCKLYPKLNFTM